MASDVVTRAVDLAEAIRGASHRVALHQLTGEFLTLLTGIPDHAVHTFSDDELGTVRRLSEDVIECVERYVSTADDGDAKEQPLVVKVYEIRAALEEIERWRKHFH